ncbi:MAG: hypothetical protein ABIL76_06940 [candidate division WOR-3 bacterium]
MKKFSDLVYLKLSNVLKITFIFILIVNLILIFSISKVFEKGSDIAFLRGQLTEFSLMIYDIASGIHSKEYVKVSLLEDLRKIQPILNKYKNENWSKDFSNFVQKFNKFIENPSKELADDMFLLAEDLNRKLLEIDIESRKFSSIGIIIIVILNVIFIGVLGFFLINYAYKLSIEFSEPLLEIKNILSKIAFGSIEVPVSYNGNIVEVFDIFESIETLRKDLYETKLRIQEILRKYREG